MCSSDLPIDLTLEMAAEQGVDVDEAAFRALMDEQRERARADARAKKAGCRNTCRTAEDLMQGRGIYRMRCRPPRSCVF